jgi:anti-sigma-K factor RskA
MSKRARRKRAAATGGRAGWRRAVLATTIVAVLAGGALWLGLGREETSAGTPRSEVDRSELDLGYRRFDTFARAVFTLTNAESGTLRLSEVPRVRVVAGC